MNTPVKYTNDLFDSETSQSLFHRLWDELEWERRSARRIEYWTNTFNRAYTYGSEKSARTFEAQPAHEVITFVTERLQPIVGFYYEGCFLNGYDGVKTGLEWHADDDPGINHDRPIAVVTLYDGNVTPLPVKGKPAARILQTMDKGSGVVESFPLLQGSLLLMEAGMQDTHLHRIPKPASLTRPRISLTFRSLKEKI